MVSRILTTLLLTIALPFSTLAIEINVSVDPQSVVVNESFRLIFHADGSVNGRPNFKELDPLLSIINRHEGTSFRWVNGRRSRTSTWTLNVLASRPGPLNIPPVAFGADRSNAVQIDVRESAGGANASVQDTSLSLEIEVDEENPYVQEQIILTVRMLKRLDVNEARLSDPITSIDAIIKQLGKDSTYQTIREQKSYEVFERRFAIFPQTSGTMTIEPMQLSAQIVQSSRSAFDPFRQSVKTRRVESNALTLEIKPIPTSYSGSAWLPAKRLSFRDDWNPDSTTVTAGEPITRTVLLWAEGLNAGQLPEVPISLPSELKSYPDQPQTSEQQTDNGFTAIRQQKYAIIANSSGRVQFPATTVTWWNTKTDSMETATLESREFDVVANTNSPPPQVPADAAVSVPVAEETAPQANTPIALSAPGPSGDGRIKLIALFCLCGWLATITAWWWRVRTQRVATQASAGPGPSDSIKRLQRDVHGACAAKDPQAVKKALIAWGQVAFADESVATLKDISRLVLSPLSEETSRLDRYLYGRTPETWEPDQLLAAFKKFKLESVSQRAEKAPAKPLPDLYRLSN